MKHVNSEKNKNCMRLESWTMFPFFANDNFVITKWKTNFGISPKRSYHGNAQKIGERLAVVGLACITSDTDFMKALVWG